MLEFHFDWRTKKISTLGLSDTNKPTCITYSTLAQVREHTLFAGSESDITEVNATYATQSDTRSSQALRHKSSITDRSFANRRQVKIIIS